VLRLIGSITTLLPTQATARDRKSGVRYMQPTNIKPVMSAKTEAAVLRRDVCLAPLSVHRQAVSASPTSGQKRASAPADPLREARRSSGPYEQIGQTLRCIQGLPDDRGRL